MNKFKILTVLVLILGAIVTTQAQELKYNLDNRFRKEEMQPQKTYFFMTYDALAANTKGIEKDTKYVSAIFCNCNYDKFSPIVEKLEFVKFIKQKYKIEPPSYMRSAQPNFSFDENFSAEQTLNALKEKRKKEFDRFKYGNKRKVVFIPSTEYDIKSCSTKLEK